MFWIKAREVYEDCRRLGLCRSQRDFSRRLLGRGPHYLRLITNRRGFVSRKSVERLRVRLSVAASPTEVAAIQSKIDQAEAMADWLRRR